MEGEMHSEEESIGDVADAAEEDNKEEEEEVEDER